MDEDDINFYGGMFVGSIIGILLFLIVVDGFRIDKIEQLGQAICEEEYNMDFESYNNQELKCKPKEVKREDVYDGIMVRIK